MKIWKNLENFYGEHINKLKLNIILYKIHIKYDKKHY